MVRGRQNCCCMWYVGAAHSFVLFNDCSRWLLSHSSLPSLTACPHSSQ